MGSYASQSRLEGAGFERSLGENFRDLEVEQKHCIQKQFHFSSVFPYYFLHLILVSISICSTAFLTEDGLFDIIRASNHGKARAQGESKKSEERVSTSLPKQSPQKTEVKSRPQITHIDIVIALFLVFDSLK